MRQRRPTRWTSSRRATRADPVDPEIGLSPAIAAPLAPSDPQVSLDDVTVTANAPNQDYSGASDYFSDTTKPTAQLEAWQTNALERVLAEQNRTTVREGQWLRKIRLTVYAQAPAGGGADNGKTGAAGADQGGDQPARRDDNSDAGGASGGQTANKDDQSTGIDLSQLRINFSIKKTTNSEPNLLKARVYNLSKPPGPDTVGKVKQYARVQLAAGYDDNFGMLFDGQVILYVTGKENPVDSYIDIIAGDGDVHLNHGIAALNWPAGSTPSQRSRDMLSAANVPVGDIVASRGEQKSIRSQSFIGMLDRGIRRETNATQSDFFIDDGKAYMIPWEGYRQGDIVDLSPTTGLVGIPKVTPNGIEAQCLLNPKLRLGGLVHIATDLIADVPFLPGSSEPYSTPGIVPTTGTYKPNYPAAAISPTGYYKILLLNHFGDNRGNEWYSAIVGTAAGKDGTLLHTGYAGNALGRLSIVTS